MSNKHCEKEGLGPQLGNRLDQEVSGDDGKPLFSKGDADVLVRSGGFNDGMGLLPRHYVHRLQVSPFFPVTLSLKYPGFVKGRVVRGVGSCAEGRSGFLVEPVTDMLFYPGVEGEASFAYVFFPA